jgi:Sec-independent protein secretion pathway component TatC
MYLLYELSIFCSGIIERKRAREELETNRNEDDDVSLC